MHTTNFLWRSIAIILALSTLISCGSASSGEDPIFSFVYMTDIHVLPERYGAEGFTHAIQAINEMNPDLVLSGGDMIFDALGQSFERSDSLYFLFDSLAQKLKAPLYTTLGNHEVFGLYTSSGVSQDHPEYGKQMYLSRRNLDQTYYSFDHKGWHFVVLDAIGFTPDRRYYGYVDSLQLDWLQTDLARLKENTPIIVSTHIPLVSVVPQLTQGSQSLVGKGYLVTNTHEVMQVLRPYNIKLVLQGHLHLIEHVSAQNIQFLTGGAVSARWWRGPNEGLEEGFVRVNVYSDSLAWEYIDMGWEVPMVKDNKSQ